MADTELLAAIQEVLKKSLIFDGVTRGIRESVRCIEAGQVSILILVNISVRINNRHSPRPN